MTSDHKVGQAFGKWKLIGIVSFGPRVCGTENVPGVYSRVRHYIDWILDNVEP
jgi:secreted trypsin-like serine protease